MAGYLYQWLLKDIFRYDRSGYTAIKITVYHQGVVLAEIQQTLLPSLTQCGLLTISSQLSCSFKFLYHL